jgi:hypothetical protein
MDQLFQCRQVLGAFVGRHTVFDAKWRARCPRLFEPTPSCLVNSPQRFVHARLTRIAELRSHDRSEL